MRTLVLYLRAPAVRAQVTCRYGGETVLIPNAKLLAGTVANLSAPRPVTLPYAHMRVCAHGVRVVRARVFAKNSPLPRAGCRTSTSNAANSSGFQLLNS